MDKENFSYFLPLSKVEKTDDGHRMVSGYASTPCLDIDGEIISLDAMKSALPGYMEWRNIRQMHQPLAIGVAKEANIDDVGLYLRGKIVDANAIRLLDEGVLKGFSIGGKKLSKKGNVITSLDLVEISLVDRPANPECRIDAVKSAGSNKLQMFSRAEDDAPPATESETSWLRKTVERLLGGAATPPPRKPLTFQEDVGHEDDTDDVRKAAEAKAKEDAAAKAAAETGAFELDAEYVDMLKAAPSLFGPVVGPVDPAACPGLIEFAKSPESILYLEPEARERLAKSIMVVSDMAYAFDGIRRAQRRLIAEGAVEKDGQDKSLAKKLGEIASELATVMAQKADHEGDEATSLTDADDIQSWELQGAVKMSQSNDLAKRGASADAIKASAGRACGHLAKAGKSNASVMECMKGLGRMFGEHAQKCAEFAKAADKDKKVPPEFDAKKAASLVKAAFDHAGESGDHMEMANVAMARLANGTVTGDHGVSSVSPQTMSEGEVPWYDAAKPYANKAATAAAEEEVETPAGGGAKTFSQAEVDALVKSGRLEAENEVLKAALSKTPAGGFKARTVIAPVGGEGDDMSILMKGVEGFNADDPDARRDTAGKMIGNMIANSGRFGKSVFDPGFRGQAGVKRQSS
jgi:hypothetical protein